MKITEQDALEILLPERRLATLARGRELFAPSTRTPEALKRGIALPVRQSRNETHRGQRTPHMQPTRKQLPVAASHNWRSACVP